MNGLSRCRLVNSDGSYTFKYYVNNELTDKATFQTALAVYFISLGLSPDDPYDQDIVK